MANQIPKQLLPWTLSQLKSVTPTQIVRGEDDKLGRLVIRLAVIFNDLKGMVMFYEYLKAYPHPSSGEISPYAGQWAGLSTQINRFVCGILNEALKVISDENAVLRSAEFLKLVSKLAEAERTVWNEIIAEANNSPEAKNQTTRAMLARLRNKTAFHYDGLALLKGFQQFFAKPTSSYNELGYYSAGEDMDGTRYFFADSATQTDYQSAGEERGLVTDTELFILAEKINTSFALLINIFLEERATSRETS